MLAAIIILSGYNSAACESQKEAEEALIRKELETIVSTDPQAKTDAQTALETLNKPVSTSEGWRARNRAEIGERRILNGIPVVRGYRQVGALLIGNEPRSAKLNCSGTLVGCDKFLTAAHCINNDPSPSHYLVFFQELGFFEVAKVTWEPKMYQYPSPIYDVAMLTLKSPAEGIAPMGINTMLDNPADGEIATIVGFGRTGGRHPEQGIKREGSVEKRACSAKFAKYKLLCWFFKADVMPSTAAQNICDGDSGGGVFLNDEDEQGNKQLKVFSVASGTFQKNCRGDDHQEAAYSVDVFQYSDWMKKAGEGRLSTDMCGQPIPDKEEFEPKTEFLDDPTMSKKIVTWGVPQAIRYLRVSMNAANELNGVNEFSLSVYKGLFNPGSSQASCKRDGLFAFCEIPTPDAGKWTAVVTRKRGNGAAQITATFVP